MGRRGPTIRYSYVCVVVLVHLFRVTSLRVVFCSLFLRRIFIKAVAGGVYGTLLCLNSVLVSCPHVFSNSCFLCVGTG